MATPCDAAAADVTGPTRNSLLVPAMIVPGADAWSAGGTCQYRVR